MNFESVVDLSNFASNVAQFTQSEIHHQNDLKLAKEMHEASIALARKQHKKDMQTEKRIYLMETFTDLEQHFQQLNADLMSSNRENESDMFDQCNQSLQTVLLGNCIMFASLSTVIFQGFICGTPDMNPDLVSCENVDGYVFISYSLSSALSFAFLFISIVLCIEVILLSTHFMYNRANDYINLLSNAMSKTRDMMIKIRYRQQEEKMSAKSKDGSATSSRKISSSTQSFTTENEPVTSFARMTEEELHERWLKHEKDIQGSLQQRNEIIRDYLSPGHKIGDKRKGATFQSFWVASCERKQYYAVFFFYLGTAFMLVAVMIYMYAIFHLTYLSLEGAVLAITILGAFLVVAMWLAVYLRFIDMGAKYRTVNDGGKERGEEGNEHGVDGGEDEENVDDDEDEGEEDEED